MPHEIIALANEVSDLTVVLDRIEHYVANTSEDAELYHQFGHVSDFVNRARDCLLKVQDILDLLKAKTSARCATVSRLQWLRDKNRIGSLRLTLRDIRLNLVTEMITINWFV